MKAVSFDVSISKYVTSTVLGMVNRKLQHGPLSCVSFGETPVPSLPGPDWVRIRTTYGGICGSDLGMVYLHDTPTLSPFASDRFVMGHENIGTIIEAGPGAKGYAVGDRVVADILLPCEARGLTPCKPCSEGNHNLCHNFDKGNISSGTLLGACATTGGSWGEYYLAHKSQLYRVPDSITDEDAALIDPLCSALHPVLTNMPGPDEKVLVIGSGIIGLLVVACLRAMGCKATITSEARYGFQAEKAAELGADVICRGGDVQSHTQFHADNTGARVVKPIMGKPYLVGGYTTIFNCVGSTGSLEDALRFADYRAKVVMVGLAGVAKLDWTLFWFKELTMRGIYCYGTDTSEGVRRPTYGLGLELLENGTIKTAGLVTHTFPLHEYRKAIVTASEKGRNKSVKVLFKP